MQYWLGRTCQRGRSSHDAFHGAAIRLSAPCEQLRAAGPASTLASAPRASDYAPADVFCAQEKQGLSEQFRKEQGVSLHIM